MKPLHRALLALSIVLVLHTLLAIALTPCYLLQQKQQELSDVKRSAEEGNILMRAFDEMGRSGAFSYKKDELREQTMNFEANLKEYKRLDKTLQMQVDSLSVLCKKEPGLSQVSSSMKTASSASNNIKIASTTTSTPSNTQFVPTVNTEGQTDSDEEKSSTGEVSEREYDIGLRVVDGAYTVGEGLRSCRLYNATVAGLKSGKYWIKNKTDRFIAYCDMTTLRGGWTLVSSRSSKFEPINSQNIVLPLSFKGESVNIERWVGLKEISSIIMITNGKGKYATFNIASLTISKVGVCSGLTNDLSNRVIFHKETAGCNLVGNDYCLIGTNFPGGSTEVANLCNDKNIFNKFDFKPNEKIQELDVYIR